MNYNKFKKYIEQITNYTNHEYRKIKFFISS